MEKKYEIRYDDSILENGFRLSNLIILKRLESLETELSKAREHIGKLENRIEILNLASKIVNSQAEDEGLWFQARTAPEAYLQQELRKLHSVIEMRDKLLTTTTPTKEE